MKSIFVKLPLIREKQQFQACLAITIGELIEGSLQLDMLHPKEKKIYQGFQHNRRKESYLLGRISAKQAISGLKNIRNFKSILIDTGVFQFPVVKGENLQNIKVCISHCDTIGFSIAYPESHPMGIDVEKISRRRKEMVMSQLTPNEITKLHHKIKDNSSEYIAIFSMKEALSKILRTGMMMDFKFLEIEEIKIIHQRIECTFTHFGQYKAFAFIKNNYVFSIVLPKKTKVFLDRVWLMLDTLKLYQKIANF